MMDVVVQRIKAYLSRRDLRVQTGNLFSPSAQCTEDANKKIDLLDKALLPKSLEIGFHLFKRGHSAPAARIWYAKPRGRR